MTPSPNTNLIERARAVVPYQGKSNIAFLCHELADALEASERERDEARFSRPPFGTWRGKCGHLWERAETLPDCPLCASEAANTVLRTEAIRQSAYALTQFEINTVLRGVVEGLMGAVDIMACSCPGRCERVPEDQDDGCIAHDALTAARVTVNGLPPCAS